MKKLLGFVIRLCDYWLMQVPCQNQIKDKKKLIY